MRKTWVYDPHTGGVKIPQAVRDRTRSRILAFAKKHYSGKYTRIDVRFRGQLCYIDAYTEPYVPPNFDASVFGESRTEGIFCPKGVFFLLTTPLMGDPLSPCRPLWSVWPFLKVLGSLC